MKQLPGEVRTSTPFPAQVKRIPASITHGIPGVAIGVGVVALIVINHVAASVWNTLPDIFSIGLVAFGLIWAFAIVNDVMKNPEKYTKNEVTASEASVFGLVLAIMVAIIGFISFFVSWTAGHPGPPAPITDASCKNHAGFREKSPTGSTDRFVITCSDGYTFSAP